MDRLEQARHARRAPSRHSQGAVFCLIGLALLAGADLVSGVDQYGSHDLVLAVVVSLAALALLALRRADIGSRREEARQVDEDEKRERELAHDAATGALVRRFFFEACGTRVRLSSARRPMAYVAVDMDDLKTLNDSLGHEVGDAALKSLVDAVRHCVGEAAILGRVGGDEFAVVMDCECADEAERIAASILARIGRPQLVKGRELSLSATIGITMLPAHTSFLTEAVQFSDLALYAGKKAGRNRAVLFTTDMLGAFRRQQQIERELRKGLHGDELRQLYLPIVEANGGIVALRAVLGWRSPWLGPVPSQTFLEVAEMTDLIDRVGEWSLRRALADADLFGKELSVSVPFSAVQLKRDGVIEMVRRALGESDIDPSRIIAVIGRAPTLSANADMKRRLNALQSLGVRIAMDDLGAIVCDFERLRDFPMDIVRIPARQIAHLGESDIDNAIVTALAGVGKSMDLRIVADGIASAEQLLLARTAGCDLFAGPLFAEPMTAAAVRRRYCGATPHLKIRPATKDG